MKTILTTSAVMMTRHAARIAEKFAREIGSEIGSETGAHYEHQHEPHREGIEDSLISVGFVQQKGQNDQTDQDHPGGLMQIIFAYRVHHLIALEEDHNAGCSDHR